MEKPDLKCQVTKPIQWVRGAKNKQALYMLRLKGFEQSYSEATSSPPNLYIYLLFINMSMHQVIIY